MSRLLDQRRIDQLTDIARERASAANERVRAVMYAEGANSAPVGMDNLHDDPEKAQTFTRYIKRQANRERQGVVGGDLNQTLVEHPAVREMAAESFEEPIDG